MKYQRKITIKNYCTLCLRQFKDDFSIRRYLDKGNICDYCSQACNYQDPAISRHNTINENLQQVVETVWLEYDKESHRYILADNPNKNVNHKRN